MREYACLNGIYSEYHGDNTFISLEKACEMEKIDFDKQKHHDPRYDAYIASELMAVIDQQHSDRKLNQLKIVRNRESQSL